MELVFTALQREVCLLPAAVGNAAFFNKQPELITFVTY